MSTSIILLDGNSNANDVDIFELEPCLLLGRGGGGETWSDLFVITKILVKVVILLRSELRPNTPRETRVEILEE